MKDCFGIYVGNDMDCFWDEKLGWSVVHACKHPCHRHAVGYSGNLSSNHPFYLIFCRESHLVLNLVDMDQLHDRFMRPIIIAFYNFMDEMEGRKILIHCNRGESRAPSLAILYLAKRVHLIPNESFDAAKQSFKLVYPLYNPGRGFNNYLQQYWDSL
ncbi:unnamed protein product [marine sediment metagenome]|uniref:Tyrosine specific protein phosphatases domain-containing protein n=1 Tax=marine sediment metagenome TaxID=412755 RepID=X1EBV9_9ZZZZ